MLHSLAIAVWIAIPVVTAGLVHVAVIKLRLFSPLAAIPLDGGIKLGGRTLFGENKTLRGALVMIAAAAGCVWLHVELSSLWPWAEQLLPPFEQSHPLGWGALAGAGYIAGELPNSFAKRRLGIGPGATATGGLGAVLWTVDQIDSMVGVLIFLLPVWTPPLAVVVALLGVTLVVHPAVALVMLFLGLKTRVG